MSDRSNDHRRVLELLPWYVNGSLSGPERDDVRRHLGQCLSCNAALREERALKRLVTSQDPGSVGTRHGIGALLHRIDAPRRHRMPRLTLPAFGYGLAAAVGGLIVWGLISFFDTPSNPVQDAEFSTLSSASGASLNQIDLIFNGEPDAAFVGAFAADIDAVVVAGPSDIGRYTLEVGTEADVNELIETLRRDSRVQFASRSFDDDAGSVGVAP